MLHNAEKSCVNVPRIPMCHGSYFGISQQDPSIQYQTQKKIQNTVGTSSANYMDVLSAITVGNSCTIWNNQSDRKYPHKVISTFPTRGNSTRSTVTSCKPGVSAGGTGCDIKHGSYARRLLRLKGTRDVRSGVIPPNYGRPLAFNPAFPIYGGKIVKTGIVNCAVLT